MTDGLPEGMTVRFWGTRGSIPTPGAHTVRYGGNTACVEVTWGDSNRLILDAGSGIRLLGEELSRNGSPPARLDILFSHLHWDHIQGLPFFIPLYIPGVELHLWGGSGKGISLDRMMDHQLHSAFFPVGRAQLSANIVFHLLTEGDYELPDARLKVVCTRHPGGSFAYRIDAGGRSLVYATDRESDPTEPDETGNLEPELIKVCRKADLLIHDAQYTEEEYVLYRRGWGHSTFQGALRIAREAGVGRLAFFHHDPSHDDEQLANKEIEIRSVARDIDVFMAVEGAAIHL